MRCLPAGRQPHWANEAGIRRFLFILLDNAFKHTPSGGTVTLSTKLAEEKSPSPYVIPARVSLPRIFLISSSGLSRGSIAQQQRSRPRAIYRTMIADLHGSKIEVESTVGSGSCFAFTEFFRLSL